MVSAFDGERQPLSSSKQLLITLRDTRDRQRFRDFRPGPAVPFSIALEDDGSDILRALVHVDGYDQAGIAPIALRANTWSSADLMLTKKDAQPNFANAQWRHLSDELRRFFHDRDRYDQAIDGSRPALATILNSLAATRQAGLMPFVARIDWNRIRPDRFWFWAEREFVMRLERGPFAPSPVGDHAGATRTFKQTDFAVANLHFSLHENDTPPAGTDWVAVEGDMDAFDDKLVHFFGEVVPHKLTGGVTDPRQIYRLRWMAGRQARLPDFDPQYVVA
jgi:hypothetical protein